MRIPLPWRFIAAALVIASTSCDSLPVEPTTAIEPSEAITIIDGFTIARQKFPRPLPVLVKAQTIGPAGGTLTLLGNKIIVPPGAVQDPTLFTMTVMRGVIGVDLTAFATPIIGIPHFVTTFNQPLTLSLSYARSPDKQILRTQARIVHVDGIDATALTTEIQPGRRRAEVTLTHFSKYMMATN